jgi:hypothetical protein
MDLDQIFNDILDQNRRLRWGLIGLTLMLAAALFWVYATAKGIPLKQYADTARLDLAALLAPEREAPPLPALPAIPAPNVEETPRCTDGDHPDPDGSGQQPTPDAAEGPSPIPQPAVPEQELGPSPIPQEAPPVPPARVPPPQPAASVQYVYRTYAAPPTRFYGYQRPYVRFYVAPPRSFPQAIGHGVAWPFRKLGGLFR